MFISFIDINKVFNSYFPVEKRLFNSINIGLIELCNLHLFKFKEFKFGNFLIILASKVPV